MSSDNLTPSTHAAVADEAMRFVHGGSHTAPADRFARWAGRESATDSASVVFVNTAEGLWGAELSMLTIAETLYASGHDIHVWATAPGVLERWTSAPGRPFRALPTARGRLRKSCRLAPSLLRVERNSHLVTWDVDLLPLLVALRPVFRRRGITTSLDVHLSLTGRITPHLTRFLARWVDNCICISAFTERQVAGRTRTHIVQRPVTTSVEPPARGRPGTELSVGIVGRLDPEKRVELAIEAVAAARCPANLVVRGAPFVGTATYCMALRRTAELAGVPHRFEGRVPQREALAGLDVLLHCNPDEPAGRVVQEAQLSGVVALVPDRGGAREFVEDGVTGMVFQPGSADDIARKLDLLADPDRRAQIARNARERAVIAYNPERQSTRYLRAIRASGTGRIA